MNVVWLKRDTRLGDHKPLALAASSGRPFIILFMYEPDQLSHESVHGSHIAFVNEGLQDMEDRLRFLGGGCEYITTRRGEATRVLAELHHAQPIARLLSHEETGHGISYARDRRVASWCSSHDVEWLQLPQSTVVRGLSSGESWQETWRAHLESFLQVDAEENPFAGVEGGAAQALQRVLQLGSVGLLRAEALDLPSPHVADRCKRQKGGESRAVELLLSFLNERGERYSGGISSPNSAWTACSRLSPYLAWGHISIRTVWQQVERRRLSAKGKWARSLQAFITRLQWRCMYCQRFEMRCWMEHRSLCGAWEHLREGKTFMYGDRELLSSCTEEERLSAFEQGRTGYPIVDACMRCLLETGWLNFRMRCMLVSFAVYNLWLDWRAIAGHLARCFLDYEPGIHYPQLQMQAGTTGTDLRCYSMTRQAKDQDPDGIFIRRYVAELSDILGGSVREPWRLTSMSSGSGIDASYPSRIVDELKTSKASKAAISALQEWYTSGFGGKPPCHFLGQETSARPRQGLQHSRKTEQPEYRDVAALLVAAASGREKKRKLAPVLDQEMPDAGIALVSLAAEGKTFKSIKGAAIVLGCWVCPSCTLVNGSSCSSVAPSHCEACGGARPASCARQGQEVIELD